MPRKTDPRWGDKGQHVDEKVSLEPADINKLIKLLGVARAETLRHELAAVLSEYISDFFRTYEGDHLSFTRAAARTALLELQRLENLTVQQLDNLNARAELVLYDHYAALSPIRAMDSNRPCATWFGYVLHPEKMETAIANAIAELGAISGPDRDTEIQLLTDRLLGVYENVTGERATHSNKDHHLAYDQTSQSKAGGFVQACYDIVNKMRPIEKSKVLPSRVSNSLRRYVAARCKTGR